MNCDCTVIPILYVNFNISVSQVKYKKGHDERKAKYTSLADTPEMELAKKNFANRSNVSKNHKSGQSCSKAYCFFKRLNMKKQLFKL